MSEYLSKEEIKQWRSSLEKITLEEFAARLGKKVEEKKETNDLIDIVLHGNPVVSEEPKKVSKVERLSSIAEKAYEREKEIYTSPFSAKNVKLEIQKSLENNEKTEKSEKTKDVLPVKTTVEKKKNAIQVGDVSLANDAHSEDKIKSVAPKKSVKPKKDSQKLELAKEVVEKETTANELRNEVRLVLKKTLTAREQKVLDYFSSHKNEIVYAKDLAELLGVPRDYVYKYIKNIREKIESGDSLKNADKGGFIFS